MRALSSMCCAGVFDWEEVVREGRARIVIPRRELFLRPDRKYEPAWSPVFYNPEMRTSRDLTVLVNYSYFGERPFFYIDSLAGTGVRGIRLALETGGHGIVNDVDPIAYYYMVRNIELNDAGDRVKPFMCESNALLNSYTFSGIPVDYIDVDPYGSPIPFIDSAVKPLAKRGLIGVTATDTAPLACTHKHKALRRYNVICTETDFEKELGLRVLLYNLAYRSASQDVALKPVLSYYQLHYYRVFFVAERSAKMAYELISKCRGYLWYCPETLERGYAREVGEAEDECASGGALVVGPLWTCSLGEIDFVNELIRSSSKYGELIDSKTNKLLSALVDEYAIDQPYVRYDKFFSVVRRNMVPISEFISAIRERGYSAYRTHFDPRGVKTNAPVKVLVEIFS